MNAARAPGFVAATVLAVTVLAVALAASASAAKPTGNNWAVAVPKGWQVIPRTKAKLRAEIAALKKKKTSEATALATTLSSILNSATGASGLKAYVFQAFLFPTDPATPILEEVSLGITPLPKNFTTKELPDVGATYANAISENKGSKVTVPKVVKLPVGSAEFIEATIPAGSGFANGVELYLIPHGGKLYELSFQVDATLLPHATLFTEMAREFTFTK